MKKENEEKSQFLTCERSGIYALLMLSAGMMGAYTFNVRGGVFSNAQTANVVLMSIALGKGQITKALYYLIPMTAYFLGALLSEYLPTKVKKWRFLRWDTYLVGFEFLTLFLIGFIPLKWPHQIVQILINFIASMQYNTFRQSEGIPMSTTFCTNHIRQTGVAVAQMILKKDAVSRKRGLEHFKMILWFFLGGVMCTFACRYVMEKSIWLCLVPLLCAFVPMAKADLTYEHDLLRNKPHGH